jgi:CRISPR/Cas system endoribonuclease Cas6 (RAMP superfamily)
MYFIAMLVKLFPINSRDVALTEAWTYGTTLSAALYEVLCARGEARETVLRGMQDCAHQWIGVAPVNMEGQHATLRVTWLGREALHDVHAWLNALSARPVLHLNKGIYRVVSVDLAHPLWSSVRTWADLTSLSPGRFMCLRFISPTMMNPQEPEGGSAGYFPQPSLLFTQLLQKWQRLRGPALPDDVTSFLQRGGCVVADYRLRTEHFLLRDEWRGGLVGWVVYECRERDILYARVLKWLARLACFTGVGCHTEQGLGLMRLRERG